MVGLEGELGFGGGPREREEAIVRVRRDEELEVVLLGELHQRLGEASQRLWVLVTLRLLDAEHPALQRRRHHQAPKRSTRSVTERVHVEGNVRHDEHQLAVRKDLNLLDLKIEDLVERVNELLVSTALQQRAKERVLDLPIIRIAGPDRYATSRAVLDYAFDGVAPAEILLATGRNFPDALAASAAAGFVGTLLLTSGFAAGFAAGFGAGFVTLAAAGGLASVLALPSGFDPPFAAGTVEGFDAGFAASFGSGFVTVTAAGGLASVSELTSFFTPFDGLCTPVVQIQIEMEHIS